MVLSTDETDVADRPGALDAGEWARRRGYPPVLGDRADEGEEIRRLTVLAVRRYRNHCAGEMRSAYEGGRVSTGCILAVIGALDTYLLEIGRATNCDWWIFSEKKWVEEALLRIARAVGCLDTSEVVWVPVPTRKSELGLAQENP